MPFADNVGNKNLALVLAQEVIASSHGQMFHCRFSLFENPTVCHATGTCVASGKFVIPMHRLIFLHLLSSGLIVRVSCLET